MNLAIVGGLALVGALRKPKKRQRVAGFWDFAKKSPPIPSVSPSASVDQMLAQLSAASMTQYALFCAAHVLQFFQAEYPKYPEVRNALRMAKDKVDGKTFSQADIDGARKDLSRIMRLVGVAEYPHDPGKFSAKYALAAAIEAFDFDSLDPSDMSTKIYAVTTNATLAAKGSLTQFPARKAEYEAEKKWQQDALRSILKDQKAAPPRPKAIPYSPMKPFSREAQAVFDQLSDKWRKRFSVTVAYHVLPNYAKAFPNSQRVAKALKYAKDLAYGNPVTEQSIESFGLAEASSAALKKGNQSAYTAILAAIWALRDAKNPQSYCAADAAYSAEGSAGDAAPRGKTEAAKAAEKDYQLATLKKFLGYQQGEKGGRVNTGQQAAYDAAMKDIEAKIRTQTSNEQQIQAVLSQSRAAVKRITDYVVSTKTFGYLTDPEVIRLLATPAQQGGIPEWIGWGLIGAASVTAAVILLPEVLVATGLMEGGMTLAEIVEAANLSADAAIAVAEASGSEAIVLDEAGFARWMAAYVERMGMSDAAYESVCEETVAALKARIQSAGYQYVNMAAKEVVEVSTEAALEAASLGPATGSQAVLEYEAANAYAF